MRHDRQQFLQKHPLHKYFSAAGVGLILAFMLGSCHSAPEPVATDQPRTIIPVGKPSHPTDTPEPTRPLEATLPASSTLDVTVEDLQGLTIQFWHPWENHAGQVIGQLIDQFNRTNPWDLTVEAVAVSSFDLLAERVGEATENGTPPELIVAYTYQALEWEANGLPLVDLDPYIIDPLWGLSAAEQADFSSVIWDQDVVMDRRYGIPAWRSAQLLFYNQTWASELGFSKPPETPEEFKDQVCAAANAADTDDLVDNNHKGGWRISTDYGVMLGWLGAFDARIWEAEKDRYRFDTQQTEACLSFLRELYEAGCAWLPEDELPFDDFASRRGLIVAGNLADIQLQEAILTSAGNPDEWLVLAYPGTQENQAVNVYGPAYIITESSQAEQLASWLVIKWLLQPDHQAELVAESGHLPTRLSVQNILVQNEDISDHWKQAVSWLYQAYPEPTSRSWSVVRWTLNDVGTQLYRWYFTLDQLPETLELWDLTAEDLQEKYPNPDE